MSQRLPSLHLLRLFEAAARQSSFKHAAEELHLTPSAVSHQVKALEEQLGITLFHRHNRRIEVTPAGRALAGEVGDALQTLEAGLRRVTARFGQPALRVTTVPSFAGNHLIPRLSEFQARHPGLDLRIETSFDAVDLRHEHLDVALRIGQGEWPGLVSRKLFNLFVTPVCSPDFAERHALTSAGQLAQVPLIALPDYGDIWRDWAERTGQRLSGNHPSLAFSSYEACIQAARQGLGAALAILPIEQPILDAGALVAPLSPPLRWRHSFYAVHTPHNQGREDIAAFIDWVQSLCPAAPSSDEINSTEPA